MAMLNNERVTPKVLNQVYFATIYMNMIEKMSSQGCWNTGCLLSGGVRSSQSKARPRPTWDTLRNGEIGYFSMLRRTTPMKCGMVLHPWLSNSINLPFTEDHSAPEIPSPLSYLKKLIWQPKMRFLIYICIMCYQAHTIKDIIKARNSPQPMCRLKLMPPGVDQSRLCIFAQIQDSGQRDCGQQLALGQNHSKVLKVHIQFICNSLVNLPSQIRWPRVYAQHFLSGQSWAYHGKGTIKNKLQLQNQVCRL